MAKKTVLITGSSTGLGRAAALAFQNEGWQVAATMRNTSDWPEQIIDSLITLSLNVCDPESIQAALAQTVEHFGHLDCVVNNAGQGLFSVFETTPIETARALFETNFFGYMQVMQAALPYFRANGGGRFINLSSGSGIRPEPLMSIYGATKHAVEALTESVSFELATQNVSVKLIEPGMVRSTNFLEQTKQSSFCLPMPSSYKAYVDQIMAMFLGRSPDGLGTEEDVAKAIVEAATDETNVLRKPLGADTELAAHMRWETSEEHYRTWTLSMFAAKTEELKAL